jgi:hypothetical protein
MGILETTPRDTIRNEGLHAAVASRQGTRRTESRMGRGLILWLIGIPLPIILLLWLFGFLS